MNNKAHLEEVLDFIRVHRASEANFEALHEKLVQEIRSQAGSSYTDALREIEERQAQSYRQIGQTGATAWPEFENFTAAFEKAITVALKEQLPW